MTATEKQQRVLRLLGNLQGLDPLKNLFWSELGYERVNEPLSRRSWSDVATNALAENPLLFAAGGNREGFHILYARLNSDKLLLGLERPVISTLLREHPYSLIILSNTKQDHWHFVNVKYDTDIQRRKIFRRIVVGPHERLRTAAERIALLDLDAMPKTLFGLDALAIQAAHDDAFDVEAVTEQFFGYYQIVFDHLQKDLHKQTRDAQWAHDFAQQFLNRLMFLYFIQRKRWLNDDPDFVCDYWETYKKSGETKDSFYRDWLSVLFFEAFNNQFQAGRSDRQHLPKKYRDALALAPYLNGGLFAENGLDKKQTFRIGDDVFVALFDRFDNQAPGFFERYNFTIREDSPFDQEVAVDPEMIGKVYESLVNVTSEGVEEEDQRGNAGIFYTQRIEIDLMCRLALVDYLANHLGEKIKPLIYQAVFAYDDADKQAADKALAQTKLWAPIDALLRKLTVCDPACGSGSFIVGMLMVVDDLQARANAQLGIKETMYQRRKRIIGQSLYGVDVMDWAVHTAELRLWLQLIVETDLTAAEMQVQPLLPNLSFKLRVGDSLVQQVGGIIFNVDREHLTIPAPLKRKLTALKEEKLKFYNDVRASKFKSEEAVKKEELYIFREILDARADDLDKRIRELKREIAKPPEQLSLLGMASPKAAEQLDLFLRQKQEDLETAQDELAEVESARAALRSAQNVPFVWDIAFVEIFEDDEKGFGIMVGNPPYVRQEAIADPHLREEDFKPDAWREKKKEYKAQLQQAVAEAFPKFFNYKHGSDKFRKLDGKSDLYVYFYLLGMKRLNPLGAFCFITSNSWLDVGYGKDLQEFLLTQSHVKMILDNEMKRSFKQADVNTIIALLAPPKAVRHSERSEESLTARFAMFRTPFENVLSPVVFQQIEQARERTSTPEYRVTPIRQSELLAEGIVIPEGDGEMQTHGLTTVTYEGGKWGGRYLRAPDVFHVVLEKGIGKLVQVEKVAATRRGYTTGADDWFYMTTDKAKELSIERKYLRPILTDPGDRNVPGILLTHKNADLLVIDVHTDKRHLKGTGLLQWIERGEKEEFKGRGSSKSIPATRPSVSGRQRWYELPIRDPAPILWIEVKKRRCLTLLNKAELLADRSFYDVVPTNTEQKSLCAALNCTLVALFSEFQGNAPGGSGAGVQMPVKELRRLLVFDVNSLEKSQTNELLEAFDEICKRPMGTIYDDVAYGDRRALDDVIFDALKLTRGERDGVYEAVVELVKKRLEKAGSV